MRLRVRFFELLVAAAAMVTIVQDAALSVVAVEAPEVAVTGGSEGGRAGLRATATAAVMEGGGHGAGRGLQGFPSYSRFSANKYLYGHGYGGGNGYGGYCRCPGGGNLHKREYKDRSKWFIHNKHYYFAKGFGSPLHGGGRRLRNGRCRCPVLEDKYDDRSYWKVDNKYHYYGYPRDGFRHPSMTRGDLNREYGAPNIRRGRGGRGRGPGN